MYDIKQFRPALYTLLLLGVAGFTLAIGSPGLWLLATGAIVGNAWLVRQRRFRPIPRLVANGVTLAAGAWCGLEISDGTMPVGPIGVFLVILQVVKLYEQRGNRDYGQLIVLSLLTMVAGAMTGGGTALLFGLLFLGWVFVSLYTCLLFHLKVETDAARRAIRVAGGGGGGEEDAVGDAMPSELSPGDARRLRQDQRRLGSSMRRLTAAVAISAAVCGAIVFLLFPRGTGSRFFGSTGFQSDQTVTGFSGKVGFQDIARIQQDNSPVAYVWMARDGVPVSPGRTIYLRGNTLDLYESDPEAPDRWTWKQSVAAEALRWESDLQSGRPTPIGPGLHDPNGTLVQRLIEQRIELEPTGVTTLFSLAGPVMVEVDVSDRRDGRVNWSPYDDTLEFVDRRVTRRLAYTVWSTGRVADPIHLPPAPTGPDGEPIEALTTEGWPSAWLGLLRNRYEAMRLATADHAAGGDAARWLRTAEDVERARWAAGRVGLRVLEGWDEFLHDRREEVLERSWQQALSDAPRPPAEAILDFALDPNVTGVDAQGRSLAEQRLAIAGTSEIDGDIATNLERYLRTNFRYSLDVSAAAADLPPGQDPLGWFVSESGRQGHCEFFAGTMALACQALGIPARVVVGFKSDEYNPSIERHVVRRSDAHAWVEVLTIDGWRRYDPTSSTLADSDQRDGDPWGEWATQLRHWGEFIEYFWANNVVAYDQGAQESVRSSFLQELNRSMGGDADAGGPGLMTRLKRWLGLSEGGSDEGLFGWLRRRNLHSVVETVALVLIVTLPLVAAGLIGAFLLGKWRLLRRARRIGLEGLPRRQARRLARELGFYDDMARVLARRGFARPPHLTPREFARSLTILPPAAYDAVATLTDGYYRVRYGRQRLTNADRRRLEQSVQTLASSLG